ncbi:hypothetical protein Q1695_007223 [Nippostrongylus brasiliensis]|nr:hypothetical protein Q1695_007223 [Nippostrongylus brasiliensis]
MGKCRAAVGWGKTALGGSKQDKRPAGLPELALRVLLAPDHRRAGRSSTKRSNQLTQTRRTSDNRPPGWGRPPPVSSVVILVRFPRPFRDAPANYTLGTGKHSTERGTVKKLRDSNPRLNLSEAVH